MKIGVSGISPGGFGRYGERALERMRSFGFAALDYNLSDTEAEIYKIPDGEARARLLRLRADCDAADIEICQTHGPWRWPPRDFTPEDRAERMASMKKSIAMTEILGVENWVVHPIMPFGVEDIGSGNEKATWDMNVEFMTELLGFAKEHNVTICLENMPMPDFSLGAPEAILRFVKEMNDESFRICLDVGHVTVYRNLNIYEETVRLGSYIRCLHVHDNKQERDLHLFPGFGRTDWTGFMRALSEIGYDGVFNLETAPPESLSDELFEKAVELEIGIARGLLGFRG